MIETSVSPSLAAQHRSTERQRLIRLYGVESLVSVGGVILTVGIFFYTQRKFGWGAQHLLLCGAQGLVYIIGALAAHPISARMERRRLLRYMQAALLALSMLLAIWAGPIVMVVMVLLYVLLAGMQWPLLESLISSGAGGAKELSRRISVYNLIWSATVAVAIAGCGPIIAHWPVGLFVATAAAHLLAWGILLRRDADPPSSVPAHLRPEPELIPLRTLAMRLSRVVLPASYAVTFSLIAMMPTLPAVLRLPVGMRPLVGNVWMMARLLSFVLLGASGWWHTRPRALLVATLVLFGGFLGVTLISSPAEIILCQIAVGFGAGMIYSGSLYFGMVLSSGSTEHGGYHEALIGLGSILGPGTGALAEVLEPGKPNAGVLAVAIVLSISVIGMAWVSLLARQKKARP